MKVLTVMAVLATMAVLAIGATRAGAHDPSTNPYCGHHLGPVEQSEYTGTFWRDVFGNHYTLPGWQAGWPNVAWVHYHVVNHYRYDTNVNDWVYSYTSTRWCNFDV